MSLSAVPTEASELGDPASISAAATGGGGRYSIRAPAGRWLVVLAFGPPQSESAQAAHRAVLRRGALFDDVRAAFFGLSDAPMDRQDLAGASAGLRYFWDFGPQLCAALGLESPPPPGGTLFLIDPAFRILIAAPIEETDRVLDRLEEALTRGDRERRRRMAPIQA